MKRLLLWLVWKIPLGSLAPLVLGVAIGRMPMEVNDNAD